MNKSKLIVGEPSHTENAIIDHQQAALQFLELVSTGQIDEAYRKYVDLGGKHHNPYFKAGFPALREAMKANQVQFPNMRLTVKNVIVGGDLVAVHSHVTLSPGETGMAVVHMFRFQGNRIVEMWDLGQPVPADSPNQDGMF